MTSSDTLGGRMHSFELDQAQLDDVLRRSQNEAARADYDALLERGRAGAGLSAEEIALLWSSSSVST